ncbi:hypothetical protein BAY1663_02159 [Pseudomonas sp. BAY1663]|uniref:hypothetical protein n=1 Tax=Pseudomonas sp. BAY1663 TaxID=1439940 RepID=UPI00042DF648|nr:hypothetical protein [Pseudomonas sp. BAY1663]EXF45390.1 hypothetical protein BAY1663_02159 [Pseudomonas sp. BAY1663]
MQLLAWLAADGLETGNRAKRAGGNRYVFSGEAVLAARPEPGADPLSAGPAG